MFAWATPEHLLDYMSIEEVFYWYDKGLRFEEFKAKILVGVISEAMEDPKNRKKTSKGDKPDKKAFYSTYGDKIERPGD